MSTKSSRILNEVLIKKILQVFAQISKKLLDNYNISSYVNEVKLACMFSPLQIIHTESRLIDTFMDIPIDI